MSLYLAGIGADATTETSALKAVQLRAKTFPKAFDANAASTLCREAVDYGRNIVKAHSGAFKGVKGKALNQAVDIAAREANFWDNQAKKGSKYLFRQFKNAEYDRVRKRVMQVYIEASGVVGERRVVVKARQDLKQDLADNAKNLASGVGWGGIGIGVAALGILVLLKKG